MNALAAIGTVADVVPLVGDNRIIVKNGLECINRRELPVGLLALLRAAGLENVDEQTIGFVLGPLLNAAGRILDNGAMISLGVLITENYEEADQKANELIELNQQRKQLQKEGMTRAYEFLAKEARNKAPICIYDPELLTGIAGLVAGRLSEELQTPAFVLTKAEQEGLLKGSGRSYGGVHLKELLDKAERYLTSYGGHAGAAGLSIQQDVLQDFKAIHENQIWNVNQCKRIDESQGQYEIYLTRDGSTVRTNAISFEHYEYEERPLFFIKSEMSDAQKLLLISKMDEWYGNTDQDTTDYALEFAIVVRMILDSYLVINPRYLAIEEVLQDILGIIIAD